MVTTKIKKSPAPKPPKKLLDTQQKMEIVRLMLWALPTLLQAIAIGVLLLLFRSWHSFFDNKITYVIVHGELIS